MIRRCLRPLVCLLICCFKSSLAYTWGTCTVMHTNVDPRSLSCTLKSIDMKTSLHTAWPIVMLDAVIIVPSLFSSKICSGLWDLFKGQHIIRVVKQVLSIARVLEYLYSIHFEGPVAFCYLLEFEFSLLQELSTFLYLLFAVLYPSGITVFDSFVSLSLVWSSKLYLRYPFLYCPRWHTLPYFFFFFLYTGQHVSLYAWL